MLDSRPRYGGITRAERAQLCAHCIIKTSRLIVVASESAGREFECLRFALKHTRFLPFFGQISTSNEVPAQ